MKKQKKVSKNSIIIFSFISEKFLMDFLKNIKNITLSIVKKVVTLYLQIFNSIY